MENVLYIIGSAIGLTLASYIYKVCQILGVRFFLSGSFREELYDNTRSLGFSPLRIVFFWITKIPYPFSLSSPHINKESRLFTPLALLCGPLGLFIFAFALFIIESFVLYRVPLVNEITSLTIQISVLTALISLLPIPPLDGARILTSIFILTWEPKVLQYMYVFPISVLTLRATELVFGLHVMDRVLATLLDIILFVFQLGITP